MSVLDVNLEVVERISTAIGKMAEIVEDKISPLAAVVMSSDNPQLETAREACRTMQDQYNEKQVGASTALLNEASKFEELKAAIDKGAASIAGVKSIDADMNVAEISVPNL